MTTHVADSEEIIDAYRAAVEHANGRIFASELQVSFRDGWFTVRDLEGAESRYRKKEIIAVTQDLLKQPEYRAESVSETAAHSVEESAKVSRTVPNTSSNTQKNEEDGPTTMEQLTTETPAQTRIATSGTVHIPRDQNKYFNQQVAEAKRLIAFPVAPPTPALKREAENKAYFRNLRRIFMIVAAAATILILFILLKGK